jgi:prepilin-type N-terminal cleavage/methylation domain-containing protein
MFLSRASSSKSTGSIARIRVRVNHSGFTLIELLVVVGVIAILGKRSV